MSAPFQFVLSDSGLDRQYRSTSDDLAGMYSAVAAVGNLTQTAYSGSTAFDAYQFVQTELAAAGVAPWVINQLAKFFAHRIAFHSSR